MEEEYQGQVRGLKSIVIIAGIIATLVASAGLVFGLLTNTINVSNTGVVATVGIGVYTTQQCTANLTEIDWGTVYPGSNYGRTGYVRNDGNANITLTMTTTNWSPTGAATTIGVGWNYDGSVISPGQVLAVTWTLSVPSDVSGIQDFSFDIMVSGSG